MCTLAHEKAVARFLKSNHIPCSRCGKAITQGTIGALFSQRRRLKQGKAVYCSDACRYPTRLDEIPGGCAGCGCAIRRCDYSTGFWNTKIQNLRKGQKTFFCSMKCRHAHQKSESTVVFACKGCGAEVKRKPTGGKDDCRFCSRECFFEMKVRRKRARAIVDSIRLKHKQKKLREKRAAAVKERANAAALIMCVDCGKRVTAGRERCRKCAAPVRVERESVTIMCVRCCAECVVTTRNKKKMCERCVKRTHKNESKHKKRCQKKGLEFDSSITLAWAVKRYLQRCFWCKRKTLRTYKHVVDMFGKTADKRSPTLDHVVPLSRASNKKHGHTASNVVLCCMECNSKKCDAVAFKGLTKADNPVAFASSLLEGGNLPEFQYA